MPCRSMGTIGNTQGVRLLNGIPKAVWFHIRLGGYSGVGCIGPFFLTIDKYDDLLELSAGASVQQ